MEDIKYVFDVGNTTISYAKYIDGDVVDPSRVATSQIETVDQLLSLADNAIGRDSIVVASIGVKRVNDLFERAQHQVGFNLQRITGSNTHGALISYGTPLTLGPDRIANTIAVTASKKIPCIVVDCGTAITIDVVNSQGEFIGGMIAPGIETSRNALTHFAPSLPDVELVAPDDILGRDTISCIQSGVIYGAAAMIEKSISKIKKNYDVSRIVLTGGHAELIHPLLEIESELDIWLTLRGLGSANIA